MLFFFHPSPPAKLAGARARSNFYSAYGRGGGEAAYYSIAPACFWAVLSLSLKIMWLCRTTMRSTHIFLFEEMIRLSTLFGTCAHGGGGALKETRTKQSDGCVQPRFWSPLQKMWCDVAPPACSCSQQSKKQQVRGGAINQHHHDPQQHEYHRV